MKSIDTQYLLFPLLLLLITSLANGREGTRQTAKVIRVVDGDTIIVSLNGKSERIRLLRVNTPESVHPDKKQNVPAGKVASEFAKKRLAGKTVELEKDGSDRDRYKRLLRYVWVDGKNFCLELVKEGQSPFYTPYGHGKYKTLFEAAEREARKSKKGIWGDAVLAEKYLRLKSKWGQRDVRSDRKIAAQKSSARRADRIDGKARESANPENNQKDKTANSQGYVASRKSKVFHNVRCRYVKTIAPNNLTLFDGRSGAVESGRRPCKECKP